MNADGSAEAAISGEAVSYTTPNASVTAGLFTGTTDRSGAGRANTGARALAEGSFAIPFDVTLPVIPGSSKTFSVILGVAANNPLAPSSGGGGGS